MFDDLLASFENTLKQAKEATASLSKQVKQSMIENGRENQDLFFNPMLTYGKAVSFGKEERWKEIQKQDMRGSDFSLEIGNRTMEIPGGKFAISQRFVPQKQEQLTIINPNYDVVKKNNKQAPKIVTPKDDLDKSRLSIATAASSSEVGPGKYFVNSENSPKKSVKFPKDKRFKPPKPQYEDTPLFINEEQTKKRIPTAAVLKQKTQKNKKQISLEKQQQLRERLKFVYWQSIPLQFDRLLKKNSGAPLLRQNYFNIQKLKGKQKICALLYMMDKIRIQRGGFENSIAGNMANGRTMVRYRKSTPKPFKFSEMEPGPDYYYPQDDLIKPGVIGFSFGKQEDKIVKEIDHRDYDINEQYFKKGGNIVINPEHKPQKLSDEEISSLNRGPGFYDCLFSQVQKRTDIGVIKLKEFSSQNPEQNYKNETQEIDERVYFPSYQAIDPKIKGPLYKEPTDIKPMHMPDKELFPEHWIFYDGDLNKVRAEIAKNVLIGNGLTFEEYQNYSKKFSAFKKYMELRKKQVEALEYEPKFTEIDPHVEGFDMKKKPEKNLIDPIVKSQFDVDGDNLILEPQKLKKKLPEIKFQKMIGRDNDELGPDDLVQGDILLIEPKKPQRHVAEIDFSKMPARPEIQQKNDDMEPPEGDRIVLNPKTIQRKIANIDFGKQVGRTDLEQPLDEVGAQKQQLILYPEKPHNVKGFVEMGRMTGQREALSKKNTGEKVSVIRSRILRKISRSQQASSKQQRNDEGEQDHIE